MKRSTANMFAATSEDLPLFSGFALTQAAEMPTRVIHLTLCGPSAGRPLCDINKAQAKEQGHEFYHASLWRNMNDPHLCPNCRQIVEEVDAEIEAGY